jgi:hypothetical protein
MKAASFYIVLTAVLSFAFTQDAAAGLGGIGVGIQDKSKAVASAGAKKHPYLIFYSPHLKPLVRFGNMGRKKLLWAALPPFTTASSKTAAPEQKPADDNHSNGISGFLGVPGIGR